MVTPEAGEGEGELACSQMCGSVSQDEKVLELGGTVM